MYQTDRQGITVMEVEVITLMSGLNRTNTNSVQSWEYM